MARTSHVGIPKIPQHLAERRQRESLEGMCLVREEHGRQVVDPWVSCFFGNGVDEPHRSPKDSNPQGTKRPGLPCSPRQVPRHPPNVESAIAPGNNRLVPTQPAATQAGCMASAHINDLVVQSIGGLLDRQLVDLSNLEALGQTAELTYMCGRVLAPAALETG